MTELEFKSLANEGYNRIPLIAEALADLETPLSLYLKLAQAERNGTNSFLLESVVGGERFGRYSFIGLPARTLVRTRNGVTEVVRDGQVVEQHEGDPLEFVAAFQARFKVARTSGLPRFCGGLAGYFGYDAVRYIEKKLAHTAPPDDLGLPDIQLLLTEELAVIDNLTGKLYLIVYADPAVPEAYARGKQRLRELRQRLRATVEPPVTSSSVRTEIYREFARDDYLAAVRRAKEYIAAGELMQVQVGQRLTKPYRDNPLSLYRALRSLNPSPYMYFYNFGDFQVVGASPEILVRQEKRGGDAIVTIRPLAGTRPRGNTPERDAELATELLNDPKEIAEHVMLIDLAPQRRRPHRANRFGRRDRQDGHRKVLARAAHREFGRRQAQARHDEFRRPARHLPRRHALGRAEGACDGAHRRARARQARPIRRRGRLSFFHRRDGSCHYDPYRHHP